MLSNRQSNKQTAEVPLCQLIDGLSYLLISGWITVETGKPDWTGEQSPDLPHQRWTPYFLEMKPDWTGEQSPDLPHQRRTPYHVEIKAVCCVIDHDRTEWYACAWLWQDRMEFDNYIIIDPALKLKNKLTT